MKFELKLELENARRRVKESEKEIEKMRRAEQENVYNFNFFPLTFINEV